MNSSAARPRDPAPAPPSILAHPWFARMIGLWFAALFGLSSLALAPAMLERMVTTIGIDRVFPAAAPPLGQTARLLLAMGMAGVGEIVGLLVGTGLAAGRSVKPLGHRRVKSAFVETATSEDAPQLRRRDHHPDAPARRPLSATSDLGDAMAEEPDAIEPRMPGAQVEPGEPLSLAPFEAEPGEMPETAPLTFASVIPAPGEPVTTLSPAPVDGPSAIPAAAETDAVQPAASTPGPIASANLEDLGVVQLSERLAVALQARRERRAQAPAAALPTPRAAAGAADPDESDRTLRAALASLQRVSGAR